MYCLILLRWLAGDVAAISLPGYEFRRGGGGGLEDTRGSAWPAWAG